MIVQQELPSYMRKLKSGEIKLKEETDSKTFNHYAKLYRKKIKDLRETTKKTYNPKIKFWEDRIGDKDIKDITASSIQEILDDCEHGLNYRRELLQFCTKIFKRAIMDRYLKDNSCNLVELARANSSKEIFPFSKSEVALLLERSSGVFRNMLAISFYTGMRIGELKALKWQNINLKNRTIYIDSAIENATHKEGRTKNRQSVRYVPIFNALVPYIEEQRKRTGLNKFLFTTRNGNFYQNTNLYKQFWTPLLRRCNLPHRRLYETRHTFASNMIYSNEFNLNTIAKWMGHKGINTLVSVYNNYIQDEDSNFDVKKDIFDTKNVTEKFKTA